MPSFIGQITHWHWWILGGILLVLEIFAPGTFFLWSAVAAGMLGFVLLLAPQMGWEYQVLLFAVLSVSSILAWRGYRRRVPEESARPLLNRRGEQYIGHVFTLAEPIVNGQGRVKVGDGVWRAEGGGGDLPAGTRVKVVGVDGVVLRVEPL
jgi:membrane protein implicated in regulation of membrane protease activity